MCGLIAILLLIFGGLFGISSVERSSSSPPRIVEVTQVAAAPTPMFACESATTPEQETSDMLALVGDSFAGSDWSQELHTSTFITRSAWSSNSLGALAILHYINAGCDAAQKFIDSDYYSERGFQTILSNYSRYDQTAFCQADGVELHEFSATASGQQYHILYWIKAASTTHVEDLMLAFPVTQDAEEADYAGKLFPDLPACPEASSTALPSSDS